MKFHWGNCEEYIERLIYGIKNQQAHEMFVMHDKYWDKINELKNKISILEEEISKLRNPYGNSQKEN